MPRPFALIGLTAFLVLAVLYNASSFTVLVVFLVLVSALALSMLIKQTRSQPHLSVLLASAATACLMLLCLNEFYYYPQLKLSGSVHKAEIVLTDEPEYKNEKYYINANAEMIDGEKTDVKLRLAFSTKPDASAYDTITGDFYFYQLGSSSEDLISSYKSENRFLGAYAANGNFNISKNNNFNLGKLVVQIRTKIKSAVMTVLPNDYGALGVALVLGDRTHLSDSAYTDLRNCGATHIICVSGLHLSLWSAAILWVLTRFKIKRKTACVITIPAVLFLMLLTGMTYSVMRAGIMMIIYLLSVVISARNDSLNSLGISVCAILCINPYSAGSVSFKLSVLATMGIILCNEYIMPYISKISEKYTALSFAEKPIKLLLITASAALFTAPVTLTVFGSFNFAVFPSNLLIVGLAEICMISTVIGAIVALISTSIINIPALFAGITAKCILGIASIIGNSNITKITVSERDSYIIISIVFAVITLFVMVNHAGKKIAPFAVVGVPVIFLSSLFIFAFLDSQRTVIKAVDTENGNAIVISCKGENILLGCSGEVYNGGYLISDAVGGKLDAVILPDNTAVNTNYLSCVLSNCSPEKVYLDNPDYSTEIMLKNTNIISTKNVTGTENISVDLCFDKNGCASYIVSTDDMKVLVVTDSNIDLTSIDKDVSDCDVMICFGKYPGQFSFDKLSMVVISADNTDGVAYQNQLLSMGIDACATAGNGNIIIYGINEKITVERG